MTKYFKVLLITTLTIGFSIQSFAGDTDLIDRKIESGYVAGFGRLTITPLSDGSFKVHFDRNECKKDKPEIKNSLELCEMAQYPSCRSFLKPIPRKGDFADASSDLTIFDRLTLQIGGMPEPGVDYPVAALITDQKGEWLKRVHMYKVGEYPEKEYYTSQKSFFGGGGELEPCTPADVN